MLKLASPSGRHRAWLGRLAGTVRNLVPGTELASRLERAAALGQSLATWVYYRRIFGYGWAGQLLNGGGLKRDGYGDIEQRLAALNPEWQRESIVGLGCLLDVDVYMRSQLLRDSDTTSMASSLELRVPYVDLKVAEFSRSCADDFKLRQAAGTRREYENRQYENTGAKRVLIEALKDILPPDVAKRPKRGFAVPDEQWAQSSVQPLIRETCSRQVLARRGLLDPDLAVKLGVGTSPQRLKSPSRAWALMILESWCRAVIDAPLPKADSAVAGTLACH